LIFIELLIKLKLDYIKNKLKWQLKKKKLKEELDQERIILFGSRAKRKPAPYVNEKFKELVIKTGRIAYER